MNFPKSTTVLVIGAGIHGLVAAKTYLQCSPTTSLLIIDRQPSLGGVWAREKLYPGLKTNNQLGTLEFSDFPMHARFGVETGKHIPGESLNQYIREYAETWDLLKITKFGVHVETCEKVILRDGNAEGVWRVKVRSEGGERYDCISIFGCSYYRTEAFREYRKLMWRCLLHGAFQPIRSTP